MAGPEQRNFNTFELLDDVTLLARGVVRETAELLQFDLSRNPSAEELGRLVGELGPSKTLRENQSPDIEYDDAVSLVERSAVQQKLNARSLWTPEQKADSSDTRIITGGVANWMDRSANIALAFPAGQSKPDRRIWVVTGNREMNSFTERRNDNVVDYVEKTTVKPTETSYAMRYVTLKLRDVFKKAKQVSYDTSKGDELAKLFVHEHADEFAGDRNAVFVRVANAGIQLALQFRSAAKELDHMYDSDPNSPQAFVQTDAFPLASEEELEDHARFQSAHTALRQMALTAKLIRQTQEELDVQARQSAH